MAETETDQILDGIEPTDAGADTGAGASGSDTAAGDVQDTTAGDEAADTVTANEGQDATESDDTGEPDTEASAQQAASGPAATEATYQQAVTTLDGLQEQQKQLDTQLDQLDKDVADGKVDTPRIQLLTARQNRLERQIAVATNAVTQQRQAMTQQREQAVDTQWKSLGTKYADIADTPDKAVETLKQLWDEEYDKAQKSNANAHPERIAGKAEAAWENRIALLRAQKGKPGAKPALQRSAPSRLTPGTASAPTSPSKEKGAVVAERTLGPLAAYKF